MNNKLNYALQILKRKRTGSSPGRSNWGVGITVLLLGALPASAHATSIFQIGDREGAVAPTVGADEFIRGVNLVPRYTVDFANPFITPGSTTTNASVGYLGDRPMLESEPETQDSLLAANQLLVQFQVASGQDYSSALLEYGRYGAERDDITLTKLGPNGTTSQLLSQTVDGTGEELFSNFTFNLGGLEAGVYQLLISYVPGFGLPNEFGGLGNGHFIDYIALSGSRGPGTQVPEPTSIVLLGAGALAMIRSRKQKQETE